MSTAKLPSTLVALATTLRRRPMTALQISEAFDCCLPTVYARVRALQAAGIAVAVSREREPGKTGPTPQVFSIR